MCEEGQKIVHLQIQGPQIHSRKKFKKLRENMFCNISHLKISKPYKYISTMTMHIHRYVPEHIYTHVYAFICIHTQLYTYGLYHNCRFCNAKETKCQYIFKMPIFFLTKYFYIFSFQYKT